MADFQIQSNHSFDREKLNPVKKWWIDIDKINFVAVLIIMIFGLAVTASSSPAIAKRLDAAKFIFLQKQFFFVFVAIFLLISVSFLSNEKIKLFGIGGFAVSILLLIAVLIFGLEAKGAKRWISFLGFALQPSEFTKTFFIICNAYILQKFHLKKWTTKYLISALLFLMVVALLIMEPDFGMTLTFSALWLSQLFVYGLPTFLILIIGFFGLFGSLGAYLSLPHVEHRINKFLDSEGQNYQVERSLDAFVHGSFFGTGPGNGVVKNFIPDAHTDFVFAVIGEEYGIITCVALLLLFAYLITRIVLRALNEENMFTYLCLSGLVMQFAMQVIVNTGVSLRLLPTKGMTLPFISYGGSSMISMSICFGLILAFTKRKYHHDVDYGNMKLI